MGTLGIVGGMGPESTVEYYKQIIQAFQDKFSTQHFPHILIESLDLIEIIEMIERKEYEKLAQKLITAVRSLAERGTKLAAIASNTPHLVFDRVQAESPIPLISIVDATCKAVKQAGYTRVGLLGTQFTMRSDFYSKVFEKQGIKLVVPAASELETIQEKIMGELEYGIILPATRGYFLEVIKAMRKENDLQGVILGCTELPLILKDGDIPGLDFFDTTKIHVRAIVDEMEQ